MEPKKIKSMITKVKKDQNMQVDAWNWRSEDLKSEVL